VRIRFENIRCVVHWLVEVIKIRQMLVFTC